MNRWKLLFFDGTSAECYDVDGDPQQAAIEITRERPELQLIAAVAGTPTIRLRDSARTAECGLEGWPPFCPDPDAEYAAYLKRHERLMRPQRQLFAKTEVTYGTDPAPAGFVTTALLVPTPGQEWQPIANAPRDGTVIFGRSDTRQKLTFWDREVGAFVLVYDGPGKADATVSISQKSRRAGVAWAAGQAAREKITPVIETFEPIEWTEAPAWGFVDPDLR